MPYLTGNPAVKTGDYRFHIARTARTGTPQTLTMNAAAVSLILASFEVDVLSFTLTKGKTYSLVYKFTPDPSSSSGLVAADRVGSLPDFTARGLYQKVTATLDGPGEGPLLLLPFHVVPGPDTPAGHYGLGGLWQKDSEERIKG